MAEKKGDPKGPRKRPIAEKKTQSKVSNAVDFPHKHCSNCGLSIKPDAEYCSDDCRTKFEKMVKRKKQMMYLPYIGIILIILFYILAYRGF